MSHYLYGLTVQGIQSYIFSTNKLKEIIGASEIIEHICTKWFDKFCKAAKEKNELFKGVSYLQAAGNIRFKCDNLYTAQKIYTDFHQELLHKAPGVPFSQSVVPFKETASVTMESLDKELRAQRNIPQYAFDMGIMARSKSRRTGEAATTLKDADGQFTDLNTGEKIKILKGEESLLEKKTKGVESFKYPSKFREIADGQKHRWLAVVHIDGNGMGKLIKDITNDSEEPFEVLKDFSISIENATKKAFQAALPEIYNKEESDTLPLRPIILGGDDVTFIIRADWALRFTKKYLEVFESQKVYNNIRLTACAGIAFVKDKFPFHYAATLSEDLCRYAKDKSEGEHSCLMFHRVQDSFVSSYKEIIQRELSPKIFIEAEESDFNFSSAPYNKDSIAKLLDDVHSLKQKDSPKNAMREWIDLRLNDPLLAKVAMQRLEKKATPAYKKIISNRKSYIDYQTLLAVKTKTLKE